jgi:hypothetical protein
MTHRKRATGDLGPGRPTRSPGRVLRRRRSRRARLQPAWTRWNACMPFRSGPSVSDSRSRRPSRPRCALRSPLRRARRGRPSTSAPRTQWVLTRRQRASRSRLPADPPRRLRSSRPTSHWKTWRGAFMVPASMSTRSGGPIGILCRQEMRPYPQGCYSGRPLSDDHRAIESRVCWVATALVQANFLWFIERACVGLCVSRNPITAGQDHLLEPMTGTRSDRQDCGLLVTHRSDVARRMRIPSIKARYGSR